MGFGDTLKELLDQGLAVSKELATKAGEKAQVLGEKGFQASKDFAVKAGAKVQEIGEKGVLLVEIKQLENQTRKLIAGLGAEAYRACENGASSFNFADPEVQTILAQIAQVKDALERREAELKAR
jgi:hypothetical protein